MITGGKIDGEWQCLIVKKRIPTNAMNVILKLLKIVSIFHVHTAILICAINVMVNEINTCVHGVIRKSRTISYGRKNSQSF